MKKFTQNKEVKQNKNHQIETNDEKYNDRLIDDAIGIIGIGKGGAIKAKIFKESKENYHAIAMVKVASQFGIKINDSCVPYYNAINATASGIIIIQLLENYCLVYLPEVLTNKQFIGLKNIMNLKRKLKISFEHKNEINDYVDYESLMKYADSIITKKANTNTMKIK